MAYGLKVWDASGTVVLIDTSLVTARLINSTTTSLDGSGTATYNASSSGGRGKLFAVAQYTNQNDTSLVNERPTISINQSTHIVTFTGIASKTFWYYIFRAVS